MATRLSLNAAVTTLDIAYPRDPLGKDGARIVLGRFLDGERHGDVTDEELAELIEHHLDTRKFKPTREELLESLEAIREAKIERGAIQWEAQQAELKQRRIELEVEEGVRGHSDTPSDTATLDELGGVDAVLREGVAESLKEWTKRAELSKGLQIRVNERRAKAGRCHDCDGTGIATFWYESNNRRAVYTRPTYEALPFEKQEALSTQLAICDCSIGNVNPNRHTLAPDFYSPAHNRTLTNMPLWPQLRVIRKLERARLADERTIARMDLPPTLPPTSYEPAAERELVGVDY